MAFSEIEVKRIDATVGGLCRDATVPEYSDELRFVYETDDRSVTIYEERPPWRDDGGEWTRKGVARFEYTQKDGLWWLYWMRSDLEWYRYDPAAGTADLRQLVQTVEKDGHGAFFG